MICLIMKKNSEYILAKALPVKEESTPAITEQSRPKDYHDAHIEFQIQQAKDDIEFRYGFLEAEHPAQKFLEKLVRLIPDQTVPLTVRIAANWNQANACAFEDGLIIASRRLIEDVQNQEALLGILCHEVRHVTGSHAKQQRQMIEKSAQENRMSAETIVRSTSISRLAEYDADLRGTIQTLRKMGVNPLGYKMFLEQLAKKEKSHDLAHGASQDRINNLTDALFSVHIPSTEARLHPIPEDILIELKNTPRTPLVEMSRGLMISSRDSRQEIAEKQQYRISRFHEIPDTWVPHVVRTAWEKRIMLSNDKSRMLSYEKQAYEADKQFFELALQHWYDMIEAKLDEKDDKRAAISYILFDQAKVHKEMSFDSNYNNLTPNFPNTREGMQKGMRGWKQWFEHWEGPMANIEEEKLAIRALQDVYAQKSSKDFPWIEFDEDVHEWALAIQASQEKRMHASESTDDIESQIFGGIQRHLPMSDELANRELKYLKQRKTPELGELGERVKPLHGSMYQQFLHEKDVVKVATKGAELLIDLSKDITDRQKLIDAVWMMHLYIDEIQAEQRMKKVSSKNVNSAEDLMDEARVRMVFASVFMWKQLLDKHPSFAQLSQTEKRLEMYLASTLGMSELKPLFDFEKHIPNKVVDQIAAWRSKDDVMSQAVQHDDPGYLMRRVEEGMRSWNFFQSSGETSVTEQQEVTNALIAIGICHLEKMDIPRILEQMNDWKRNGVIDLMAYLEKNPAQCGPLVTKLTELIAKGGLKNIAMQDRLRIVTWISSPHVRSAFERACAEAGWNSLTYDQKLQLTFPKTDERGIRDGKKREQLIEEEMGTREELHRTKTRFEDQVDNLLRDGNVGVGVATLLDINLRAKQSEEVAKYLEAMLQSGESDARLKQLVYEMMNVRHVKQDDDDDTEGKIDTKEQKQEMAMNRVAAAEQAVNSLLALSDFSKHVLLRKLLASPGGALTTSERRAEFFKILFKKWVKPTPGQEGLTKVLDQVQRALIDSSQWELVFVGLQGSLRNALLIPPPVEKQTKWEDIYEIEEDLEGAGLDAKRVLSKAVWTRLPSEDKKKPWKHPYSYSAFAEKGLWQALGKAGFAESSQSERQLRARSPLAFIKETVSNMSAMGVRLLQNLPLAAEIPEEYAREFSEVFDNMKGQSKLAALDGLELVWPEVWEEFDRIGKRIGGGSIVTVYEAVHASGREEVVKVQNPNIRLHITALRDFAKSIIATLAKKDAAYAGIESLVDDIHEWIEKDLEFEGFIEKDARFHAQHHGYQPEGFTYRILVPQSFGPANKYFSREERIRATNFTEWDELVKQGHDMREVISLAVRSYIDQVQQGQALSDIHPGNLAITKDKQLALYDRNYFLEFTPEQQAAIAAFINPFANPEYKTEAIKRCIPGLVGGGTEVQQRAILDFASAASEADWKRTQSALMRMRLAKIRLPIEMTLLLKNLQAFHLMAKKAGFKNLIEAMTFSP